jgi:hypothetical protein
VGSEPLEEVHILWLTAGLSCDGDTIAATAARLPSIEDIVLGAIPGIPRVKLHNPVLATEWFTQASLNKEPAWRKRNSEG